MKRVVNLHVKLSTDLPLSTLRRLVALKFDDTIGNQVTVPSTRYCDHVSTINDWSVVPLNGTGDEEDGS